MVIFFQKMAKYWFIFILTIFINLATIKTEAEFGEPPFLEGPKDERVIFGPYTAGNQDIQFEEEIEEPITIAYINYGEKSPEPQMRFSNNEKQRLLGAELQFNEDAKKWALIITKKQDYETPTMQEYEFSIYIGDIDNKRDVHINIINIPDNHPIITANKNKCEVKESEAGLGLQKECTFNVRDIDQMITDLEYTLEGEAADEFFDFETKIVDAENAILTLKVIEPLNFDEYVNLLLLFTATNKGKPPLSGSVSTVVKVINLPLRPPRWQKIVSSLDFDEKEEQSLTVLAKDGDVEINKEIHYKIELENENENFFEILDKTKGDIHIKPIDRDELQKDIFYFTIIAYKADNESSFCDQRIVVKVNDINDQIPEITIPKEYEKPILILEETYHDFETLTVYDKDSVQNARYTIELKNGKDKVHWNEAFALKPSQGYQKTDLQLIIMNATLLDFDEPEWQNISLQVHTTETVDPTHVDQKPIEIRLINLNDEEPIFESNGNFKVSLREDVKKGTPVCTVTATDRDIGDKLIYSLSDTAKRSFEIDKDTGKITTKLEKSLDHEEQVEVSIQVYVQDTFIDGILNQTHKAQGEVIITVGDVNDKTPKITLEYDTEFVSIVENIEAGKEVEIKIIGEDPDSTAKLEFLIDWDTSRAVKQGRNKDLVEFTNCLKIEWKEDGSNNKAIAKLIIQEVKPNVTIDYELYEMLYINVTLIDQEQEINKKWDSVTIPLYIIDVNDNPPIFNDAITDQLKYVRDKAEKDTIIGTVLATDADGPEFNYVTYYIEPLDDIPDNLVKINKELGEIRVQNEISCDEPNYWPSLNYTVIASDCENREGKEIEPCHRTPHKITITINDVNDQKPTLKEFTNGEKVDIYENETSGYFINQVDAFDADRDKPYRSIWYVLNAQPDSEIKSIFNITEDGSLFVNCVNGPEQCLDRDHGEYIYQIDIRMYDNQNGDGNFNQKDIAFTIELLDINDNAPIFDDPKSFQLNSVKENVDIGTRISKIHATDIDDPALDNSKVVYGIAHAYKENDESQKDYADLFEVTTDDEFDSGFVNTKASLKDHFGVFKLNLTAHDKGKPPQSSSAIFTLEILKHNFQQPKIIFPTKDLALLKPDDETQLKNLITIDGKSLSPFEADDGFNGEKWKMTFTITPEDIFSLEPIDGNQAKLSLKEMPDKSKYDCTLTVTDNGDPSLRTDKKFIVNFVNNKGQPQFDTNTASKDFHEDTEEEKWIVEPEAIDPFPEGYKRDLYYFIIGDQDRFNLNKKTRELSVKKGKSLDRNIPLHTVLIGVTTIDSPPSNPSKESTLNVTIKVLGTNKYSPKFERGTSKSGIHSKTPIDQKVLTLQADDEDLHYEFMETPEKLRYELDVESIKVSDPSLEENKDEMFGIDVNSGEIHLKRAVIPIMKGYYTFNVHVIDAAKHQDSAEIYVYVITEEDQIMFAFNNTVNEVEKQQAAVADTFTDEFNNECNIDIITNDLDSGGGPLTNRTRVFTHFIKDNELVEGETIKSEANDLTTIFNLRQKFLEYNLIFDYAFKESNVNEKDMQQLLQTILIVVVAVLGTLCILLFAAFVVRTRSLNQRLEALSTTKFGSQDSNLNRIGAPLPNTNQFSVQGSNPVWNDDIKVPEYDVKSVGSGDSTLVGIEDSLAFTNLDEITPEEQRRSSFNPVIMQQEIKRKSLNPMANQNLNLNDEL
ncbi:cadherin-23-like [Chrysoperla carnea]|uniref:cadherin-23-like n=1 Tax=Chrysoperla carnea TaxID=189513 RepID=UPI001D0979D8|nr:cadherin-23-like [Chrysoperla carnea]